METLFTELTLSEQASVSGGFGQDSYAKQSISVEKVNTWNSAWVDQDLSVKGDKNKVAQAVYVDQSGVNISGLNGAASVIS